MKKLLHINILLGYIIYQNLIYAGGLPDNSALGFGTQSINNDNVGLIQDAIDNGYRLFDGANLYKNIEIIAPILQKNLHKDLYFIYKISPPKTLNDVENTMQHLTKVTKSLGRIDCLMFHSVEEFYDETIDTEIGQTIIERIKNLITSKSVTHFGVSNIGPRYRQIIEAFSKRGLTIKVIENKFDNNNLHEFPTADIVSYCKKHSIGFIAYGALGGVIHQGPCQAHCVVTQPVVHFDDVTHPHIISLSKKHQVDVMMMVLAFEAKKYGVHHIPTTTRSERIKSNYEAFSKAYNALEDDDLSLIGADIGLASSEEFVSIPKLFRGATPYRSRLRLIENLIATDHPMLKTIEEAKFLFEDNQHRLNTFINKMIYIIEQSIKYKKNINLIESLKRFNETIKSSNKINYTAILKQVFDLDTNQARQSLLDDLIERLNSKMDHLALINGHHFELIDDSIATKTWPTRVVTVADLTIHKIVRFNLDPPVYPNQLAEKLKHYGFLNPVLHDGMQVWDLKTLDEARDLSAGYDTPLSTIRSFFATGPNALNWARFMLSYDPFSYPEIYKK